MKRRKMWWRKKSIKSKDSTESRLKQAQSWRDNLKLLERKQLQMSNSMKKTMIVQSANRV